MRKKTAILILGLLAAFVAGPDVAAEPWADQRAKRDKVIKEYVQKNKIAYDWFANFPFSTSDGTPFLILKLLPRLAP